MLGRVVRMLVALLHGSKLVRVVSLAVGALVLGFFPILRNSRVSLKSGVHLLGDNPGLERLGSGLVSLLETRLDTSSGGEGTSGTGKAVKERSLHHLDSDCSRLIINI